MTNSAINLLNSIGGTASAMLHVEYERIVADAANKQDAIDNPPEKRMAQPLRSYHKRYRNNLAEYIRAIRRKSLTV